MSFIAVFLSLMILSVFAFLYYFIDDSSFKMKLILLLIVVSATMLGALRGKKNYLVQKKLWPQMGRA
jgi:hypothetical protein